MPNSRYFDIKCDIAIVNAGGFFCESCLLGKPASESSPDPRYCQGCYYFLIQEAAMDTRRRGDDWKPKKAHKKAVQVAGDMRRIMSPLESKKIEVDIIHPPGATRTSGKRGPKHRSLPEDLIRQLAGEGMGSKAIAARLKAEHRVKVSYRTIQRILSGERKQLALPIYAP